MRFSRLWKSRLFLCVSKKCPKPLRELLREIALLTTPTKLVCRQGLWLPKIGGFFGPKKKNTPKRVGVRKGFFLGLTERGPFWPVFGLQFLPTGQICRVIIKVCNHIMYYHTRNATVLVLLPTLWFFWGVTDVVAIKCVSCMFLFNSWDIYYEFLFFAMVFMSWRYFLAGFSVKSIF